MTDTLTKSSKKTVALCLTVAVLGALAGSGATYARMKHRDTGESEKISTVSNERSDKGTYQQPSNKLPDGTLSPTSITAKSADYAGKEVKVRGVIVEISGKYIIAGQEPKGAGSINLDFSGSGVDPSVYVSGSSDQKKSAQTKTVSAFTVNGTFSYAQPDQKQGLSSYKLTVKSIDK